MTAYVRCPHCSSMVLRSHVLATLYRQCNCGHRFTDDELKALA